MNEKTTTVDYLYKLIQCTCKIMKQKSSNIHISVKASADQVNKINR